MPRFFVPHPMCNDIAIQPERANHRQAVVLHAAIGDDAGSGLAVRHVTSVVE